MDTTQHYGPYFRSKKKMWDYTDTVIHHNIIYNSSLENNEL